MLYRLVSVLALLAKLILLYLGIRRHAAFLVASRQLEHAQIQRVETRQRDELEFVSHRGELCLETCDGGIVQLLFPVERG